ncbi:Fasciclin-domain-containing protein [Eremomyces bilateralis CBS 781.70]|uniref:Fasciclin-domain-containing protein n=1 Tax=Eremomyces bilateralis CBS 781.70 TaxID=1392243 RepID=A0A6G1FSZ8_9PEZI|nr:Fasciclin-domain-containing protein [Eremomyces bilateralis CBS 781.70]KAF1808838.1 Fasciclin-domain-containing protein [Eremomyces bilateralis CBS 781.70]
MRFSPIVALAATSTAWVLPNEQIVESISELHEQVDTAWVHLPSKDEIADGVRDVLDNVVETSTNAIDEAMRSMSRVVDLVGADRFPEEFFDVTSWLESSMIDDVDTFEDDEPPHHGPPHHGPPDHKPPHHKPPHHKPPHHGPSNLTVYELISKSKYTTKLAALIDEDEDLVQLLNGTEANYTVFAPVDKAFEKLPHHHKPPKELIKKLLTYHVADGLYSPKRLLISQTIPTRYEPDTLNGPQRIAVKLSFKGLTLNYYSKFIVSNIPATNGLIHGIDSLLFPPLPTTPLLSLLPSSFSTLTLGLHQTGLLPLPPHTGATFFAPSNSAFKKLGPRINAFLFSPPGHKYLKALLQYHIVHNETLYSDAFYGPKHEGSSTAMDPDNVAPPHFHVDLPTLLEGKHLSVDVGRWGPFAGIRINGFARVAVADGVAKDGVVHVVGRVLIPPKEPKGQEDLGLWMGEEMEVEELVERLGPLEEKGWNWEL